MAPLLFSWGTPRLLDSISLRSNKICIPFAEPPLGSLRLKPPVLKTSLDAGTFNATAFSPTSHPRCQDLPLDAISEDCLTINVLRPTGTPADEKLLVVSLNPMQLRGYIYGGGFDEGLSEIYNGSGPIVAQRTPLIYVNYRLGPLGFPQGQEADNRGALNLALKDQIAALQWVQSNIGTFGGDPDKVTVFGESAGAIMTSILFLTSPLTMLARAAIFESGSQASVALFTPERREVAWQNNANTIEILQGLAAAMAAATEEFPWDPVIDGPGGLIPDLPSVLLRSGKFARLPFMAGTNLGEGTLFTPDTTNSTQEIQVSLISGASPSISPATLNRSILTLLELYPDIPALGSPFGTGNDTFGLSPQYKRAAAIDTYLNFLSQRRLWIETAANAGVPTFGYLFTQPQTDMAPEFGVSHGSEITFVYGAPNDTSPSSILLSRIMTDYWVSFATSLTPNDGLGVVPRPEWTQFTPQNKVLIRLNGDNLTMILDDFRAEQFGCVLLPVFYLAAYQPRMGYFYVQHTFEPATFPMVFKVTPLRAACADENSHLLSFDKFHSISYQLVFSDSARTWAEEYGLLSRGKLRHVNAFLIVYYLFAVYSQEARARSPPLKMSSLAVLLDTNVSAFSPHETRLKAITDIDAALEDLRAARAALKTAKRSPVKQALRLLRSRSTTKPNESARAQDENDNVLALAQDAVAGRDLLSFQPSELSLLQRALRSQRNSLAPISRLPTEVLTTILESCPTIDGDRPHFRTRKFVSALKIAHVCRRWRDVALLSAHFWTNIVLSRPRWALEMLHRSRVAPLVVAVDLAAADTKTVAARDLVLGQLRRIRELHLSLPLFDPNRLPASLLAPAPILDTFFLWTFGKIDYVAPTSLFRGETPSLRHLSLRFCYIESASPIWDNLVSLELIKVSLKIDMDQFLEFLVNRIPHLRALTLNESLPQFVDDPQPVLLSLETLELTTSSWLCYCFLRTVLLPKCRIVLNVPYSNTDLRFAWDALESQRIGADDLSICGLSLADLPPPPGSGSAFEVGLLDQPSRANPSPPPRYAVCLTTGPPALHNWREEVVYTVMAIMTLEQIATLTVKSPGLKLSQAVLHLKQFRAAVFHGDIEPFTQLLEDDPLMDAGDRTRFDPVRSAVHYPGLREIAFHNIAFSERNVEVILDWLAQRKRLNLAIDEVQLVGCYSLTNADLDAPTGTRGIPLSFRPDSDKRDTYGVQVFEFSLIPPLLKFPYFTRLGWWIQWHGAWSQDL
ncbi:Alpha/Beta hydrolase protein [Mycena maculata]|uniref:Alpha/Beta hydrolase protein n=1 Tax=Mycena maculata TaxID=230809 RepID=A0AAD7JJT3_9AGAR|nr:Alpha/Beta hydrolase protein [Mycena maculata]